MMPPYFFKYFVEGSEEYNQDLLDFLEMIPSHSDENVSKLDWESNRKQTYQIEFKERMMPYIEKLSVELGFKKLDKNYLYDRVWFHQYETDGSYFDWHNHNGHFVLLYFVEIGGESVSTEYYDTINKETFQIEVKAGEILFFPSWIFHHSPPNHTKSRKTIVATNITLLGDFNKSLIS